LESNQANLIITITSGQRLGEQLLVPPGEVRTIGRTIASDIAVGDNFMSGVHFEIENYGDFAELRDKNSTNKTWVNHSVQAKCRIAPGDVIRAGKTLFSIQWEPLTQVPMHSHSPGSIDKSFDTDESRGPGPNSFSPFASSYVVFHDDAKNHPAIAEVAEVAEVGNFPASSRSCSPFESLDASYLSKMDNHVNKPDFVPQTQEIAAREFASPFDESSIVKSPFVEIPLSPVVVPSSSRPSSIKIMVSRSSTMETDAWSIIQTLFKNCDVRVVSHFRKIAQLTPRNLRFLPVFPFVEEATDHLPIIVDAGEWLRHEDRQITDRLAQSDGLVLVLTNGTSAAESRVQELSNCDDSGSSQGMGFLGWCWPSQLKTILEGLSDHSRSQFFGESIEGFLFPSKSNWIAYANPDVVPILETLGFE
jgi:pSer/pThr/pTyr-binding forkhead associated (FHA) protein